MRQAFWVLGVVLSLVNLAPTILLAASADPEAFPEKPIKIVVYTNPGGLIDITARKVAQMLQSRYVDQPVVVENKKGAGGIVALTHVLRQPADGYTIFGLTSSVISKLVATKKEKQIDQLHFLSRMVLDYECLITRKDQPLSTLPQIVASAKEKKEKPQLWAGPASAGTDHLFAVKFWQVAGMKARWIPYRSGAEAVAALLGGHASVYVGNPQDTLGRPDLRIAAVASPERLTDFPKLPTFAELGYESLTGESLWRGFAVKKGVPAPITAKLEDLLRQISYDPEWTDFLKQGSVLATFDTQDSFSKIVAAQIGEDKKRLASS